MKTIYQGQEVGHTTGLSGSINNNSEGDLILGRDNYATYLNACAFSEFRLSNIDRSDAWLNVTYFGLVLNSTLLDINYEPRDNYDNWLTSDGSAWTHRLKIVIDKDNIDETLTDFPLYVSLTPTSGISNYDAGHFFANIDENCNKVAFTLADGMTQLYAEHDHIDIAADKASFHVKVSDIDPDADTIIYMYYDDTKADNTAYIGNPASNSVWDSLFTCVYHLDQSPTGSTDDILDSSGNANHLTSSGLDASEFVNIQNGKGVDFDLGAEVLTQTGLDDDVQDVGYITIESIVKRNAISLASTGYICECGADGEELINNLNYSFYFLTSNKLSMFWEFSAGSNITVPAITSTVADTDIHYVACTRDTSVNEVDFCIDGVFETGIGYSNDPAKDATGNLQKLRLGNNMNGDRTVNSTIGEFRISTNERSQAWMKATHKTLFDNTNTFSYETL
jgi:hypothetical protein